MEWSGVAGARGLKFKVGRDACRRSWKGISLYLQGDILFSPPSSHGDMMGDLASIPHSLPLLSLIWEREVSGHTHLITPQSCPQGKLLILLQETDFHIVDFVSIKHHQHVGFCPGFRGTVSDQESAILKQKEKWFYLRQASIPGLTVLAVVTLVCATFPCGLFFGKTVLREI